MFRSDTAFRNDKAIGQSWTTTLALLVATALLLPLAAGADDPRSRRSQSEARGYERLIGPMGNATNVRPGFYRDVLGFRPPQNAAPAPRTPHAPAVVAPVVFVVNPNQPVQPRPPDAGRYVAPQREPPSSTPAPTPPPAPSAAPQAAPPAAAPPVQSPAPPVPDRAPRPTEPQPVHLEIQPADAQVWLNDDLLGTAGELVADRTLDPGVYYLDVEHEAHDDQRLFFAVVDEPVELAVDLRVERDADRRSGRIRVR